MACETACEYFTCFSHPMANEANIVFEKKEKQAEASLPCYEVKISYFIKVQQAGFELTTTLVIIWLDIKSLLVVFSVLFDALSADILWMGETIYHSPVTLRHLLVCLLDRCCAPCLRIFHLYHGGWHYGRRKPTSPRVKPTTFRRLLSDLPINCLRWSQHELDWNLERRNWWTGLCHSVYDHIEGERANHFQLPWYSALL